MQRSRTRRRCPRSRSSSHVRKHSGFKRPAVEFGGKADGSHPVENDGEVRASLECAQELDSELWQYIQLAAPCELTVRRYRHNSSALSRVFLASSLPLGKSKPHPIRNVQPLESIPVFVDKIITDRARRRPNDRTPIVRSEGNRVAIEKLILRNGRKVKKLFDGILSVDEDS